MSIGEHRLPEIRWPLGLRREEAAAYVGVSATKFDELVAAGEMPKPIRVPASRRVVWDQDQVRAAFKAWRERQEEEAADEWASVG